MAWVIDTCVLIDVAELDPAFGFSSAVFLESKQPGGLVVCPVSFVELSPVFNGDRTAQDDFLRNLGATFTEPWLFQDTVAAHAAWNGYVTAKRQGVLPKRPVADILIGAFSLRFDGLITKNVGDFSKLFPTLPIISP